ncbi:MAG TPA: GNAT family N-acetyltransferase [Candidatus Acidoferrales bacterium]|nr:GNAT family N-acetyltransferase [Candidatus Acidoferrales bacterium]
MQFVDLNLVRRVELAEARIGEWLVHSMQQRFPEVPAAAERFAGGIATFTGVGSPTSQVIGAGLDARVTGAELDRLENFFETRGAPAILELCSFAAPSFVEMLNRRRYTVVEFSHVLLRKCERNEQFDAPPPEISIREVRDPDASLYTETVAKSYAEFFAPTKELLDVVEGFCYDPLGQCCLALINGQPAGGGAAALSDGIGTLGGAGVLPEFRGRGIQSALIAARMRWLAAQSCEWFVTVAHPGSASHRNMERFGFSVAYARMKVIRNWE